MVGLFCVLGVAGGITLADTATMVAEPSTEESLALETETVDDSTDVEELAPGVEGTERDFDAELKAAREEAATEARESQRLEFAETQQKARYQRDLSEAAAYRQQTGVTGLRNFANWVADRMENGDTKAEVLGSVNPQVLAALSANLEGMAATEQWQNIGDTFDGYVKKNYPDWKPSAELLKRHETAITSRDPVRMFHSRWEMIESAIVDTKVPALVEAQLKAQGVKSKQAAQVARTQNGDAAKLGPRPATGGGISAPRQQFTTMLQVDTAYSKGQINKAEMYRNLRRHEAGQIPYQ